MFLDGFIFCNAHQRNIRHHENFKKFNGDLFRMNGDSLKINGLFRKPSSIVCTFHGLLACPYLK